MQILRPYTIRIFCLLLFWTLLFLSLSLSVVAQTPTITWQKTLGGSRNDYAYDVQNTSDGGQIVAGFTDSNDGDVTGNHGSFDMLVVKFDGNGNKLWQKVLGGSGREFAHAVTQTLDGGYVVAGFTESYDGDVTSNNGSADFWIVKLDGNGNKIWQKALGGLRNEVAHAVIATSDGGYIVAGDTESNNGDVSGNHGYSDYWVVKLDEAGNKVWQKTFGGSGEDRAADIKATLDGGYIVSGHIFSNNGDITGYHPSSTVDPLPDYWAIKIDGAGNLIWQKALGGSNTDYAVSAVNAPDGGYVVAGFTFSVDGDVTGNHGNSDYWVIKLDGSGNIVWKKALGGTGQDDCYGLTATNDGGYVVVGNSNSTDGDVTGNHGGADYWVVKLDGNGNKVWQKSLGGSKDDRALAVIGMADGSLVTVGNSMSNNGDVTSNYGGADLWIVKLGASGLTILNLTASHDPVCAGKPVLLTASIGNNSGNYSYTITNGTGVNVQGTSSTPAFTQPFTASGSGLQSLSLIVNNAGINTLAIIPVTVISDGNCNIPTPCASLISGDWSNPATWLCGHEPTVNDIVIINPSHVVSVLNNSAQAQRIRFNDGRIRYASTGTKVFVKGE